ncbi:unnamed protein product [Trichobilharzia regenti]|nr:unnamed protein product [Trichobilharzia regenti]
MSFLSLSLVSGFPDGRIARAYLYPNVKTDIPPFEWELPRVPLLAVILPCDYLLSSRVLSLSNRPSLLFTHVNASLGWSAEKTEALLASVLKHRQTIEFGNPEKILSSKPLITNFFPVKDKMCKNSETNGDNVDASELDEVSMPSKRVRRAANRLRTKKADNQSPCESPITLPSCSTSIKDKDNSLSELPKPRKSKRKQTAKNLPEKEEEAKEELSQVKSISNKKCTKKSQKKSQRRVVERVCLSEEDD